MCHEAMVRLACNEISVLYARRFVTSRLREWGMLRRGPAVDVLDAARLAVSELAANAAKFAADHFVLKLTVHRDALEISISDDGKGRPVRREMNLEDTSGRGLMIVASISDDWGMDLRAQEKTVWCRIPLPPDSAVAAGCTRSFGSRRAGAS